MTGEAGFQTDLNGVGLGLRPPHYQHILERRPPAAWFEAVSENYLGLETGNGGRPLHILESIRQNYPVVLHGVSLSIGSTDPLNRNYLARLKALVGRIEPSLVSDHVCWTGIGGQNVHDLLPLPYTEEAVAHIVERVMRVQDFLGRRLVLENVSSYLTYTHSEMTEWDFLAEIARRADCGLLLDVNNIHVSAVNHQFEAAEFLRGLPRDRIAYMHLAGYSDLGTHLVDTHDHPVSNAVWNLYEDAVQIFGPLPTLIEWDDKLPSFEELSAEAAKATAIRERISNRTANGTANRTSNLSNHKHSNIHPSSNESFTL